MCAAHRVRPPVYTLRGTSLDWQNIATLAASPLLGLAGALLKDVVSGWREKIKQEQVHDTTLEVKKLDEAGEIRKELREQVARLTADVASLNQQIQNLYGERRDLEMRTTDLEIAILRYASRIEEFITVINFLLEAEEHLDAGHVRRARAFLRLAESDKQMLEQMRLDESGRQNHPHRAQAEVMREQ